MFFSDLIKLRNESISGLIWVVELSKSGVKHKVLIMVKMSKKHKNPLEARGAQGFGPSNAVVWVISDHPVCIASSFPLHTLAGLEDKSVAYNQRLSRLSASLKNGCLGGKAPLEARGAQVFQLPDDIFRKSALQELMFRIELAPQWACQLVLKFCQLLEDVRWRKVKRTFKMMKMHEIWLSLKHKSALAS